MLPAQNVCALWLYMYRGTHRVGLQKDLVYAASHLTIPLAKVFKSIFPMDFIKANALFIF